MASKSSGWGTDPTWPQSDGDDHPVTELNSDRQGALSPFGDLEFPLPSSTLPYQHPKTVINTNPNGT